MWIYKEKWDPTKKKQRKKSVQDDVHHTCSVVFIGCVTCMYMNTALMFLSHTHNGYWIACMNSTCLGLLYAT